MADTKLSTEPYKGVRDFYPEDMAVQRYLFDIWSRTAESFGYERYDASVLEPAELYRSKSSEEIVNDQTYTFIDRGEREVTLRPEMTPTVARMVAGRRRALTFPLRWYAIPNLFRYERPQKGRLREHWQLNCDLFGIESSAADIEIITLAYQTLLNFGADPSTFEIRINDRAWLNSVFSDFGLDASQSEAMLALLDRKEKIDDFDEAAAAIAGKPFTFPDSIEGAKNLCDVIDGLATLGITNVVFSPSTVRGFLYYTGTIFEIFDVSGENKRSLLGGGRYDNLTALFGGDAIAGVGFGMGDVTMRDFLETHNLLTADVTAPTLMVIPATDEQMIEAQKSAQVLRASGISAAVDFGSKKLGKKIAAAAEAMISYVIVIGEDEAASGNVTLKNLDTEEETSGTLEDLAATISNR